MNKWIWAFLHYSELHSKSHKRPVHPKIHTSALSFVGLYHAPLALQSSPARFNTIQRKRFDLEFECGFNRDCDSCLGVVSTENGSLFLTSTPFSCAESGGGSAEGQWLNDPFNTTRSEKAEAHCLWRSAGQKALIPPGLRTWCTAAPPGSGSAGTDGQAAVRS